MKILEFDKVSRGFGADDVLSQVTFSVHRAEIIALLLVNTIFFRTCRPGITIRKSRVIFWILMGGLMGLHIGGYLFLIKGWTQEWLVYGFWMGLIRDLGDQGPAGYAVAWLGAILGVGAAWRLAAHALENVEAPST